MSRADFPLLERRLDGRPLLCLDSAATALKPAAGLQAERLDATEFSAHVHRSQYALTSDAVALLEQALARFAPESSQPADRATARFALARALSTPPGLQERARTEALQAPEAFTRAQLPGNTEAVERWQTLRSLSSSQASDTSPSLIRRKPPSWL